MADQKKPSQRNDGPQRAPGGPTNPGGNWLSRGWFWIVLIILLVIGSRYLFNGPAESNNLVGLDRVAAAVQADRVESIVIQGESVTVTLKDGARLYTRKETAESLLDTLGRLGVSQAQREALPVRVESAPNSSAIFSWLMMLLPILLIFGFFIFIMRQAGGGGQNRALQFGRSRARKMEGADRPTVTRLSDRPSPGDDDRDAFHVLGRGIGVEVDVEALCILGATDVERHGARAGPDLVTGPVAERDLDVEILAVVVHCADRHASHLEHVGRRVVLRRVVDLHTVGVAAPHDAVAAAE